MSKAVNVWTAHKIVDLLNAIHAVYEIRDDGKELKRGVYVECSEWKYYVISTSEDKTTFISKQRYESYNLNEIKTYLTGYLDAL